MKIGLRYSGIWNEIGDSELLQAFFSTIAYRLEANNWGSIYPNLQKKLYYESLAVEDLESALSEVKDIRTKLAEFTKEDIVLDINKIRNQSEKLYYSQIKAKNLSECFITIKNKNLFDGLIEVFEFCKKRRISIKIQNEKDLLK